MTVITHLDLHFAPEHLVDGPAMLAGILLQTRAFDGCLGIEVLTDVTDRAHVLVVEHWESAAHDQAYRDWRAGPGASSLGTVLASPGAKTQFEVTAST
jgi:quinol monooxygenase YgiN